MRWLFDRLFGQAGPPGSNPVERWQARLTEARQLKDELRYAEAASLLTDLLLDMRGLKGSAVDAYLPVTLGELGECYFQAGEAARGLTPTRQALELSHAVPDAEGVTAYLGNLYEIHRYLGQADMAAGLAEQLAAQLDAKGQPDEARRYRSQARLVRAGEPLNRVVVEIDGQRHELEEVLAGIEGGVQFHFERNRPTLRPAQILVERGQALASRGRFVEALGLFRDAAKADPFSPQPPFEAAGTLMYLNQPSQAIEEYARTEELAPAWFHCRSEMWLTQQVLLDRYDLRVFLLLRGIENATLTPDAQRRLVEQGVEQAPDLPHFHHLLGRALRHDEKRAVAAYRRGLACADEPDIRSRVLVDLAGILPPGEDRRRMLDEALSLQGNLVAQATARILVQFG